LQFKLSVCNLHCLYKICITMKFIVSLSKLQLYCNLHSHYGIFSTSLQLWHIFAIVAYLCNYGISLQLWYHFAIMEFIVSLCHYGISLQLWHIFAIMAYLCNCGISLQFYCLFSIVFNMFSKSGYGCASLGFLDTTTIHRNRSIY
jgi:hypothetical protein